MIQPTPPADGMAVARLTKAECHHAKSIGVDARRIHAIVHGQRAVTADTALLLGRFFGNSPAFWMGLQNQYDLETAADNLADRLDQVAVWQSPTG